MGVQKATARQALLCPKPGRVLLRKHLRKRKKFSSKAPLVSRPWWSELPGWIALHAERGPVRKCWEGHRLVLDSQDGRRHGCCSRCFEQPAAGETVLVCHACSWTRCMACAAMPRLPRLSEDPLFHGPNLPCLLKPPFGEKALAGNGTVIVCPGGNYEFLCPNEGLPVAAWLARHGIQALVLRYRLLPRHSLEDALADLEAAVALVRRHKDGPVAAVGFSAGGHLVASLNLRLAKKDRSSGGPLDAQVLVYPCIDGSGWGKPGNAGFWDPACHKNADALLEGQQALVGGRGFAAPPSFIVGSTGDAVCPAKVHTDPYVEALRKRGITHEYIRGNLGEHGFGLDPCWSSAALHWLQKRGFGKKSPARSWAGSRLATRLPGLSGPRHLTSASLF
ncbi:axeA1 [Symbiodinium natans]|uniref:AxeA1 protein n=1 Tax=Symbiodinium natans TaxID=878477 RepID=A0A812S0Y9_9DINO|nr:axeA1 [Symbiodinium natans]